MTSYQKIGKGSNLVKINSTVLQSKRVHIVTLDMQMWSVNTLESVSLSKCTLLLCSAITSKNVSAIIILLCNWKVDDLLAPPNHMAVAALYGHALFYTIYKSCRLLPPQALRKLCNDTKLSGPCMHVHVWTLSGGSVDCEWVMFPQYHTLFVVQPKLTGV